MRCVCPQATGLTPPPSPHSSPPETRGWSFCWNLTPEYTLPWCVGPRWDRESWNPPQIQTQKIWKRTIFLECERHRIFSICFCIFKNCWFKTENSKLKNFVKNKQNTLQNDIEKNWHFMMLTMKITWYEEFHMKPKTFQHTFFKKLGEDRDLPFSLINLPPWPLLCIKSINLVNSKFYKFEKNVSSSISN